MKPIILERSWWQGLQWQAVMVFTLISFLLPLFMHLITPVYTVPLGARLLPIFYAPFIAAFLYRYHVAVIAALCAPFLNYLITGHPLPQMVLILTIELVLFVCMVFLFRNNRSLLRYLIAPAGWVAAVGVTALILGIGSTQSGDFFTQVLSTGWPGLLVLLIINLVVVRYKENQLIGND